MDFDILISQNDISPTISKKLKKLLLVSEILILCDDNKSMNANIVNPVSNNTTRWNELKYLTSIVVDIVTSINNNNVNIYFTNNEQTHTISKKSELNDIFNFKPNGTNPLTESISFVHKNKIVSSDKELVIIVITDEMSIEYNLLGLYYVLTDKNNNTHVALVECAYEQEKYESLIGWNDRIYNFYKTNNYYDELQKIKKLYGEKLYKFNYIDYVCKILLSTFSEYDFDKEITIKEEQKKIIEDENKKRRCVIF